MTTNLNTVFVEERAGYGFMMQEAYQEGLIDSTHKSKGMLRISWSFDVKYNKSIDLIFFSVDLPGSYLSLYAKDFEKKLFGDDSMPRELRYLKLPYDINYDFVQELLSRADFTKIQQERFFSSRFGSVFVPMELEFEWYVIPLSEWNQPPLDFSVISFPKYDKYIRDNEDYPDEGFIMALGIIKSYKILDQKQTLDFSELNLMDYGKEKPFTTLFTPLPTAALAITKTKINDFFVNLRNKPNAKEGKIIATLFSQEAIIPNIYLELDLEDNINPLYKSMITKGQAWYERDDLGSSDEEGYLLYYNYKMQEAYYKKERTKLRNALFKDEYLILIWDILPNDWCRVWVLRMIAKNTISSIDSETNFSEAKEFDKLEFIFNFKNSLLPFIEGYAKDFNASVSSFKLYEGFIHSSGLEYLAPFGENYIKR